MSPKGVLGEFSELLPPALVVKGRNRIVSGEGSHLKEKWSWRRELNPRPSDYKSDALPTELRQLTRTAHNGPPRLCAPNLLETMERETGIEPATNSLEGCDSTTELLPHEVSFAILTHWMALLY